MAEEPSGEDVVESRPDLRCPVCKSNRFVEHNGRANARCASCLSVERTRLLWLVLEKKGFFRPGLRVMHMAPELALIKRFSDLLGETYYACDVDPSRYASRFTLIRPIDLCCDLLKIPSASFDVIIHVHVLEHVPCGVESVLQELERILAPGGHHFLSVPIRGEETREDLSENLSPSQRHELFGQSDHYRLFGRRSFPELLDRVWGKSERHHIEPLSLLTADALETAAIPAVSWSGVGGDTIFHRVRPRYGIAEQGTRTSHVPATAAIASPNPVHAPAVRVAGSHNLILHIGMKTGAATLQSWLTKNRDAALRAGIDYWSIAENHSPAMTTAFAGAPGAAGADKTPSIAGSSIDIGPDIDRQAFERFLSELDGRVGCISAEALWSFGSESIKNLAACLQERSIQPLILCWLRGPADFLAGAAQQSCQVSLSVGDFGLGLEKRFPIHYNRLETWIGNFGRDNVVVDMLSDDIVGQFQSILLRKGIHFEAPLASGRVEPSVSLIGVKALLALNETRGPTRGRSARRSRQLELILRRLKGAPFRLPDSILKRMSKVFDREAEYLADRFSLDRNALLHESAGVDDAAFFQWDSSEVATLLSALNDALLELEDGEKKK